MKIALIAPYPANAALDEADIRPQYRRGSHPASWVRSLSSALGARGDVQVRIFSINREALRPRRVKQDGYEVDYIPQVSPARLDWITSHRLKALQLRPLIRRFAPDLVHGFGLETGNAALALAMGFPATAFIQGIVAELMPYLPWSPLHKRMARRLERQSVLRLNGMVAETGFAERWARSVRPDARVAVIPHAVNPEFLAEPPPAFEKPAFLTAGTLSEIKGMDTVIRAFARCAYPSARLRIAGNGPLRGRLEALARSLGIGPQTDFLGHVSRGELIREMRQSSALVIASRMDTSPNVVTEAHALGLPVIGTRAGGIPDMIEEGGDGFLVPVDDCEALAGRMRRLGSDADLCRRLGAAGRSKVRILNDPARVAEAHVRFFREALEARIGKGAG